VGDEKLFSLLRGHCWLLFLLVTNVH
jgi:hypothetical protein